LDAELKRKQNLISIVNVKADMNAEIFDEIVYKDKNIEDLNKKLVV
jgi:hypothetical protein